MVVLVVAAETDCVHHRSEVNRAKEVHILGQMLNSVVELVVCLVSIGRELVSLVQVVLQRLGDLLQSVVVLGFHELSDVLPEASSALEESLAKFLVDLLGLFGMVLFEMFFVSMVMEV